MEENPHSPPPILSGFLVTHFSISFILEKKGEGGERAPSLSYILNFMRALSIPFYISLEVTIQCLCFQTISILRNVVLKNYTVIRLSFSTYDPYRQSLSLCIIYSEISPNTTITLQLQVIFPINTHSCFF